MEIPNNFEENQKQYAQMMPDYSVEEPFAARVGFGRRLGAYVIDGIINTVLYYILLFVTGAMGKMATIQSEMAENSQDTSAMMGSVVDLYALILPLMVVGLIVLMLFEVFMAASPGKLALNMRIANSNRTKATLGTLILRSVIKYNSIFFFLLFALTSAWIWLILAGIIGIVFTIGCFFVLGEKRQGFHDMLAKTAVYLSEDVGHVRQSELIREDSTRGEKNIG